MTLESIKSSVMHSLCRVERAREGDLQRIEEQRKAQAQRRAEQQRTNAPAEGGDGAQAAGGATAQAADAAQPRKMRRAAQKRGAVVAAPAPVKTVKRERPKLGRNDPCWCGSGKKYKACHMREDEAAAG